MADTADDRVQNRFLFTAPYISMARLYTKMAAVFPNYVIICTRNDVIENALYQRLNIIWMLAFDTVVGPLPHIET